MTDTDGKYDLLVSANQLDSSNKSEEYCIICFTNKPNFETTCCKQKKFCKNCLKENLRIGSNKNCPNCRQEYKFVKIVDIICCPSMNNISCISYRASSISNTNFDIQFFSNIFIFFMVFYLFIFIIFFKNETNIFGQSVLLAFITCLIIGCFLKGIPKLLYCCGLIKTTETFELV